MIDRGQANARSEIVQKLPEILTWSPSSGILKRVSLSYTAWMLFRLQSRYGGTDLMEWVNTCDRENRQRVLASPLLYHAVLRDEEVTESLRDEILSLVLQDEVGSVQRESSGSERRRHKLVCSGERLECLNDGFAFSSLQDTMVGVAPIVPTSEDELVRVERKMAEAISLVESCSPSAAHLVGQSLSLIAVGKLADEKRFISSSDRTFLGRMSLVNAQSDLCSIERLSDSLIHEGIHSFLYKMELSNPLFCDLDKASKTSVESPWTRRVLPLTSIVHACFVWFGLLSFWRQFRLAGHGNKTSTALEKEAAVGFGAKLEHGWFCPDNGVAVGVREVVESIWDVANLTQ